MTGEVSIITLVEAILSSNTSTSWDTSRGDTRVCSGCRGYNTPHQTGVKTRLRWSNVRQVGRGADISDSRLYMSVPSPHHTLAEVPWLLLPAAGNSEPGKLQIPSTWIWIQMQSNFKSMGKKFYFAKYWKQKYFILWCGPLENQNVSSLYDYSIHRIRRPVVQFYFATIIQLTKCFTALNYEDL